MIEHLTQELMGVLEKIQIIIIIISCLFQLAHVVVSRSQEIVFDARANVDQQTSTTRYSLEKSLNNLVLADQIYRENLKQPQQLLECNQKLAALEFELNKAMNNPAAMDSQSLFGRPLDAWNTSNSVGILLKSLKSQLVEFFK